MNYEFITHIHKSNSLSTYHYRYSIIHYTSMVIDSLHYGWGHLTFSYFNHQWVAWVNTTIKWYIYWISFDKLQWWYLEKYKLWTIKRRHTSMTLCCLRFTHVRHRQNAFTQTEWNSLNLGSRVKIPIRKLNYDNISKSKTLRFFKKT